MSPQLMGAWLKARYNLMQVRAPMPPTYFFVIDVTSPAMIAKSVEAIAATIRDVLDHLPGGERTRAGFLTFDAHLQFWCLKSGSAQPQMMVSWLP